MTTIHEYMSNDHRRCDELFALAEEAVSQEAWEKAEQQMEDFIHAMEHHFLMEEVVLFPAFEECSGITEGPTVIMRGEHQQMRELLRELEQELENREGGSCMDIMETLLILMEQHNMKEEGMLYPMSDEVLGENTERVITDMEQARE